MIVDCARCRTRFHLDDARVPPGGVQVRCSRCKHAFVLKPPEPARPDEPTQREAAPSPEPAPSPPEPAPEPPEPAPPTAEIAPQAPEPEPDDAIPGAELFDFGGGANPDENASEEESDWEFNTDFPPSEEVGAPPVAESASGSPPPTEDEESLSLDDVGSPEEWDLLGDEPEPAREAPPEPAPLAATGAGASPATDAPTFADRPRRPAPPTGPRPGAASPVRPLRGLSVPGWVATAFLLLVAGHGGLRVSSQPLGVAAPDATVKGLRVEELRGRRVENAYGPMLYVVSGRLTNPGPEARSPGALLTVELARPNGTPIPGQQVAAGAALASDVLREAEPARIRARQEGSARRLAGLTIPPGESIRFDAVFEGLPATAAQLRFATRELPTPPPEPATPAAATTSSSPPSAPPSSE